MNCNSNHSLFLRSNGTLVCWDDYGSLKELQPFDPGVDYAHDVYLGPVYESIRTRLKSGTMPFPEFCSKCFCLMVNLPMDDGRHSRERTIETFQIEPSMACQLDCPGCIKRTERPHRVARTPSGHMMLDPNVLSKIVADLKAAGIKIGKFDLQGHGEPLLNKNIWSMCRFLADAYPDSIISICTHGNVKFQRSMITSGVNELLFAIDGVDQGSYAPWRVNGDFQRAYDFMREFSLEAEARAPHIRRIWKYVLFSHNDTDEQLLRAQQLALDARITTIRFVITQLGPASSRVFELSDIPLLTPGPDVSIDSYRIDVAQLTSALEELRSSVDASDLDVAQTWADFLAGSLHRLFSSRPAAAERHLHIVIDFLESISSLRADRFGRYDEMMSNCIPAITNWLIAQNRPQNLFPPLSDVVIKQKDSGTPLPAPPAFTKVSDVRNYIRNVQVDEEFYFSLYPDVRKAVEKGVFSSAAEHYRKIGYCEGRLPAEPFVDVTWYVAHYSDLAAAYSCGSLVDISGHFLHHGYREGRRPSAP